MALVASSEHSLLSVARAIAAPSGHHAFESVEPILRDKRKLPPLLGATALGLLKQTLGRGVVVQLLARGGWRDVRHLGRRGGPDGSAGGGAQRVGALSKGRLWERAEPPPLVFTDASVRLLRWLVSEPIGQRACGALDDGPLGLGDELLHYLTLDLLSSTDCAESLGAQAIVKRSPLLWLAFPELVDPKASLVTPERLRTLVEGPAAILVEALQPDLARRWEAVERGKGSIDRLAVMRDLGERQERLLDAFFTAADRAGRRDLAGFTLDAARRLFADAMPAKLWTQSLDKVASLSDRAGAHRAAGAFLRSLDRWRAWDGEHRGVRFIDDGYDASQVLLATFERAAPSVDRAAEVVRELDSLSSFTPGATK